MSVIQQARIELDYRLATGVVVLIALLVLSGPKSADAREVNLANTDQSAKFFPVVSDYTVAIYVDEVDGEATKFRARDTAIVDAGDRTMNIRLEYTPASGTSLILGGLGNLLARSATNKTFRTQLTAPVTANHEYQLIARAQGDDIVIIVFDQTDRTEVAGQNFALKDGKFERVF
jgi:hypothetical protein